MSRLGVDEQRQRNETTGLANCATAEQRRGLTTQAVTTQGPNNAGAKLRECQPARVPTCASANLRECQPAQTAREHRTTPWLNVTRQVGNCAFFLIARV